MNHLDWDAWPSYPGDPGILRGLNGDPEDISTYAYRGIWYRVSGKKVYPRNLE